MKTVSTPTGGVVKENMRKFLDENNIPGHIMEMCSGDVTVGYLMIATNEPFLSRLEEHLRMGLVTGLQFILIDIGKAV